MSCIYIFSKLNLAALRDLNIFKIVYSSEMFKYIHVSIQCYVFINPVDTIKSLIRDSKGSSL